MPQAAPASEILVGRAFLFATFLELLPKRGPKMAMLRRNALAEATRQFSS